MNALPTWTQALRLWWRIGWLSFGGPAGQIALMHAELVERRRWVDESTFTHGLGYCMLLPGPEAMQLACYLGWRLHGNAGGLAAGALFILPGALLIAALAWLFVAVGTRPEVAGVLLGVQAAVLGIVAHSLLRIGRRVLKTAFAVVLALAALALLGLLAVPYPLLVLGAALVGVAATRWRPRWLPASHHGEAAGNVNAAPRRARLLPSVALALALLAAWWLPMLAIGAWLGTASTAWSMALFFSWAALVTFGGAYAVLPYVAQQAVEQQGWLDAGQMLVGLGLAESTPGPLILVLEFVGFVGGWQQPDLTNPLLAALLCAAVTLWATFLPSFLFVLPVAPWIERLRELPLLAGALAGITAAVVGMIAYLALWFGAQLLGTAPLARAGFILALALAAWGCLDRQKLPLPAVVVVAALLGVLAGFGGLA